MYFLNLLARVEMLYQITYWKFRTHKGVYIIAYVALQAYLFMVFISVALCCVI